MSASPKDQQDEAAEAQQSIDELEETQPEAENEGGEHIYLTRGDVYSADLSRSCLSTRVIWFNT
jgi:hypothetical protein